VLIVVVKMSIFGQLINKEPSWFATLVPFFFHPGIFQVLETVLV